MDVGDGHAHYLAEWYLPEMTATSIDDIVARLDAAACRVSSEDTPVRLLMTLSVPTDEVLYGVFDAQSLGLVSRTCEEAGLPHQRLSGDIGTRIRQWPVAEGRTADAAEPEPTAS